MSFPPHSPRLLKGALIGIEPLQPLARTILFQYNPETLTRSLVPQMSGAESARGSQPGDPPRLAGPPQESIRLEAILDATDSLESGDPPAPQVGLHPQLAALEMLLYPSSASVIANDVLLRAGILEVVPPAAPLTLLVWGPSRVLPVRLTEFSITEEFFDPLLNPIRARIQLAMTVLTYADLGLVSTGGALFMAHHVAKEAFAIAGTALTGAASIQHFTR